MAAAPPLPNSVTTPAGAARPALISAGVSPPGYGKLGSKLLLDTNYCVRNVLNSRLASATAARPMMEEKVRGTANQAMPPMR